MIDDVTERRKSLKASCTPEALKRLKEVAQKWGMKEYVVAGAIIDWFADQDDLYQRAVMGMLKGLEVDAATAYMKRLGLAGMTETDGTTPQNQQTELPAAGGQAAKQPPKAPPGGAKKAPPH